MARHFPKGYVVVYGKEEEIGSREDRQEESINGNKPIVKLPVGIPDAAVKKSSTKTFKITEFRIKYHREGAILPPEPAEKPRELAVVPPENSGKAKKTVD
jgi:hypothetical protein